MNKTNLGIWFDFKIQPDNEWEILFERLIQAGIKECFINATVEQLEYLISLTKNYDINIHGWIWTLNRPYDKKAIKNLDWYSTNRNGQNCYEFRPYVDYYQWLSPFSEGARDYIKNNILQIAKIDGIASVHLDYVRFCDVYLPENLQKYYKINQTHEFPEFDFGYHPNGRRAFKKEYGVDPLKIKDEVLAKKWQLVRNLRRVVTGALEIERAEKRIGSSLGATAIVYASPAYHAALTEINLADLCITSSACFDDDEAPADAFFIADVPDIRVTIKAAVGHKCARCWKILPEVGADEVHKDLCGRCAAAVGGSPVAA